MAIYPFLLKLNGVDVSTYGLTIKDLPDHWDSPVRSIDEVAIPGQDGTTATSTEFTLEPRDFKIEGVLSAASASAFEDAIDTLKLALWSSSLTMIGGNRDTRYRTGVFAGMRTSLYSLMQDATVEITVRCRNPVAFSTSATTVTGSANTDIACALGTYRSRPVITLTTSTNPSVTYKNSTGTAIHALSITGSGTIIIDCNLRTVTINGVPDDDALTGGDFFALDPQNGVYATSSWPTIRSSSGSVSATYTKAYL